jgi:L-lactate utilization protein LutC
METTTDVFTNPASEATLQKLLVKLSERNIEGAIVDDGDAARKLIEGKIPSGAEIHTAKSKTLQDAGITDMIQEPGRFDALRPRYMKMDRQTQAREIRKLIAAPDFMLGSVNAITEDGILVAASATASQIGPYANTAGKVIFVVGSQKVVKDLDAALRRIHDYVLPWEDAQVRQRLPTGSFVGKILVIEREWATGRVEVILVRKPIGM